MNSLSAEDASLAALEARATAAEQRLTVLEALLAGGSSGAGLSPTPHRLSSTFHSHLPLIAFEMLAEARPLSYRSVLLAGNSDSALATGEQPAAAGAAMAAPPMAKYMAELQGIRAVLVQAKEAQLDLEAKLKEVSFLQALLGVGAAKG